MRLYAKFICAACAVALYVFLPIACTPSSQYTTPGFTISDYHIKAVLTEDNVYSITEEIHVAFDEARHGISRTIPVNTYVMRDTADGSSISRKVGSRVTDIAVKGWNYRVKSNDRQVTILFGDADQLVSGDQTYRFSYRLHVTTDGTLGFDEVYYNIVGTDWPVTIKKLDFSLTLPKTFDVNTTGFSVGYRGHSGYNPTDLSYVVVGNTVSGTMLHELYPNQAITMRIVLPSGYFKPNDVRKTDWIVMGCMGLLAFVSYTAYMLFGSTQKTTKTSESHPPDGLTPAEIGYLIDGLVDEQDQAAMLFYWAELGNLTIREIGDDFELVKRKELDDEAKPFERHMFQTLFRTGDTVLASESKLFLTVFDVHRMIAASFGKEYTPYTRKSNQVRGLLTFFAFLTLVSTLSMSLATLGEGWWFAILMGSIGASVMMLPLFSVTSLLRNWENCNKRWSKLAIALTIFTGLSLFYAYAARSTFLEPLRPGTAAVAAIVISIFAGLSKRRPDGNNELIGRIAGFRDFILQSGGDEIDRLSSKDPGYCYGILPYAFVFNGFDRWAERFTSTLYQPDWYISDREFSQQRMKQQFYSAIGSFQSSMMPRSSGGGSSGGSSGSSGRGSSGGGSGGGGGNSW
jgi:uncharacterized membrane protein YgcG